MGVGLGVPPQAAPVRPIRGYRSMPKSRARTGEPWRPSDKVAESATFRIFNTELRDILKRCAAAMENFVELVESQLAHHPVVPCRVTLLDKPAVRRAWQRIMALRGDAQSLVVHTVASYGVSYPIPREPLTCARVKRPQPPKGCACARRSMVLAELRGWLSAHESALLDMLAPSAVAVLESREEVDSRRLGLMSGPGPDGALVTVAEPSLAESDRSIAAHCPLLVKDGFHNYQLAVADASMRDLSAKAARLRAWKPKLVTKRTLDPDWPRLVHTDVAVIRTEFRDQSEATNRNDGAAPGPLPAAAEAIDEHDAALLAFLNRTPSLRRKVSDVLPDTGPSDRKAIAKRLRKLADRTPPLVNYPKGQHGKIEILPAGIEMLKRATAK